MATKILLNSDGSIHVKDNEIVVIEDETALEDCTCCGPPQPPPGCTRCIEFVDDVPVYSNPVPLDIAFEVSEIPDTFTYLYKTQYLEYVPDPQCGCRTYSRKTNVVLTITGLSALNGTYYGREGSNFNPSQMSTVGACNASGNPFDPDSLTPLAGCDPVDPCDYDCRKDIFIQDVAISGSLSCNTETIFTCPSQPVRNTVSNVGFTVSLTGYANIKHDVTSAATVYNYEYSTPGQTAAFDIIGLLTGNYSDGYSLRYITIDLTQVFGGWDSLNGLAHALCDPPYPNPFSSPTYEPRCTFNQTEANLFCYPYWRRPFTGQGQYCNYDTEASIPEWVYQTAGCDTFKEQTTPHGAPGACTGAYIYQAVELFVSPTKRVGNVIWTP